MLVDRGIVRKAQLDLAVARQRASGRRIGSLLVEMGLAREPDVLEALGDQLGVPAVDLGFARIRTADLENIPEAFARQYLVLPFRSLSDRLLVAMADPTDETTLKAVARAAGRPIDNHIALEADLRRAIDGAYGAKRGGTTEWVGPRALAGEQPELDFDALPTEDAYWKGEFSTPPPAVPAPRPDAPVIRMTSRGTAPAPAPQALASAEDSAGIVIEEILDEPSVGASALPTLSSEARLTAVLADPIDVDRKAALAILHARAISVREARDGNAALALIHTEPVSLVIFDPALPNLHGFDLCRRVREDPSLTEISFIVTSAHWRGWRQREDLRTLYRISAFVDKPCRSEHLLGAVDAIVGLAPSGAASRAARVQALQQEALSDQRAGQLPRAIEKMREALRLEPTSAELHREVAALLLRSGEAFEAMQELEEALEIEPHSLPTLRNLALLYERRGFHKTAGEVWERVMPLTTHDAERAEIRKKVMELLGRA